jgi:preprotein translocase subunit YajC
MTSFPALIDLVATTAKKTNASSILPLFILLAIGVGGYFFFLKPQQAKAKAARASQGSDIEVGDEIQTIGGVIGTVLEVHGDRYTILTGALNDDGNLDGPQPTRIVFTRQAIARKIEPLVPANPADADPGVYPASDLDDTHADDAVQSSDEAASENHTSAEAAHTAPKEHDEEAEEG